MSAASAIVANKTIEDAFSSLINRIRSYNPFVDIKRLNAAYDIGKKAHNGQFRASGEAYFSHPIAVGYLLADQKRSSSESKSYGVRETPHHPRAVRPTTKIERVKREKSASSRMESDSENIYT